MTTKPSISVPLLPKPHVRQQHVRIDPQEIARRMTQQRQAMARMLSWLDQCPTPPDRASGHSR